MSKIRIALAVLLGFALSTSAFAQATRTWVSGVGDDANPCSRTAPCKTFAGAISKTAAGGIINVIDPGGFGAVTITKSITIDGTPTLAGVLASGTNGIVINALTTDRIMLRGLDIEGAGGGLNGVRVIQAASVTIENCRITQFNTRGVSVETSQPVKFQLFNSTVHDNSGDGVALVPSSGTPNVIGTISHALISNNNNGIFGKNGCRVSVLDSTIAGNTAGVLSDATAGTTIIGLVRSVVAQNSTGMVTQSGASAYIRLEGSTVEDNQTAGWVISSGGIYSFGDNYVQGNGSNTGSLTAATKQ